MGFSDSQMRALARSVPARHVRSRVRDGKELSYVEGWYVLAQANRIFGFDGWDRETIETKCLLGREARGSFTAVYSARVRITVRTPGGTVIRDGHGTGEAHGGSAGEVHDRALKAAETDATKRALATFGKAFGLALYAGGNRGSHVEVRGPCPAQRFESRRSGRGSRCSLGDRRGTAGRDCPAPATCVTRRSPRREVRNRPSRPGHHQRADASPAHREERPRPPRTPPGARQGAPALRRFPAVPALQRHAVGRAPCPLRAATRHGPQGRRRVHRPALPRPSSRTPPQWQRGRLVARHGHRSDRDRAAAVERQRKNFVGKLRDRRSTEASPGNASGRAFNDYRRVGPERTRFEIEFAKRFAGLRTKRRSVCLSRPTDRRNRLKRRDKLGVCAH